MCNGGVKRSGGRPAISEQLRMSKKEAGIQAGLVTPRQGETRGVYFQTGLFRSVCSFIEDLALGIGRMRKKDLPFILLGVSCCWRDAGGKD